MLLFIAGTKSLHSEKRERFIRCKENRRRRSHIMWKMLEGFNNSAMLNFLTRALASLVGSLECFKDLAAKYVGLCRLKL